MRELFSLFFDRITDPLDLPIEPWKEWIILLVLGEIAFRLAYGIVGCMYCSGDIASRFSGSLFHWMIRFIIFAVIWAITNGAIRIWQFCSAHWIAVAGAVGGLLVSGIIAVIVFRNLKGGARNA